MVGAALPRPASLCLSGRFCFLCCVQTGDRQALAWLALIGNGAVASLLFALAVREALRKRPQRLSLDAAVL